jgi:hypothetical protein
MWNEKYWPFRFELAKVMIQKHHSKNGIQSQDIEGLNLAPTG